MRDEGRAHCKHTERRVAHSDEEGAGEASWKGDANLVFKK